MDALLPDFSLADYKLVQVLFAKEMKCEAAIWRHDSLYQFCFYVLFQAGKVSYMLISPQSSVLVAGF